MDGSIFFIFCYYVPEIIPSILQVYLSETTKEQQERDTEYIDNLYKESQESIDDYKGTIVRAAKETTALLYDD
jgi:hypothetical protein